LINRTLTAVLGAPKDVVFDYLSKIENLPEWRPTSHRSSSMRMARPRSSTGSVSSTSRSTRTGASTGVIDMYTGQTEQELALFPTRVVALGKDKSAYSFTMFKAPGMPDELFESQYESLRRELDNIRARFAGEHASCAR
jgi:hypothetical protein